LEVDVWMSEYTKFLKKYKKKLPKGEKFDPAKAKIAWSEEKSKKAQFSAVPEPSPDYVQAPVEVESPVGFTYVSDRKEETTKEAPEDEKVVHAQAEVMPPDGETKKFLKKVCDAAYPLIDRLAGTDLKNAPEEFKEILVDSGAECLKDLPGNEKIGKNGKYALLALAVAGLAGFGYLSYVEKQRKNASSQAQNQSENVRSQ